jgi:hypothetical protein
MAFLSALKLKVDTQMMALANDLETKLFEGGYAVLGIVGAYSASATTFTLSEIEEVTRFELGMKLVAASSSKAALRDSGAANAITAVNRTTGVITGAVWDTAISSFAASDYLFREGDRAAATVTSLQTVAGLQAWLPASAPGSSDSFFGVNRSVDSRLYGIYHDGSADPIENAVIDAQSKVSREGGAPDKLFLHHAQCRRLIKELGAKKEYSETGAVGKAGMVAGVGYRAVMIHGDHGPIDVVAANKAPAEVGFMLSMDSWVLASLGKATKILQDDGLRMLRQAAFDGYEVRLGFRGNLACKAPIWNAHLKMPAV